MNENVCAQIKILLDLTSSACSAPSLFPMKSAQQLPDNPLPVVRRTWALVILLRIGLSAQWFLNRVSWWVCHFLPTAFTKQQQYWMSAQYLPKKQLGWALSSCQRSSFVERSVAVKATAWTSAQYLPKRRWIISSISFHKKASAWNLCRHIFWLKYYIAQPPLRWIGEVLKWSKLNLFV